MAKRKLKLTDGYGSEYEGYKLDRQELEKVLTAHSLGMLKRGGVSWNPYNKDSAEGSMGCIIQIVNNEHNRYEAASQNRAVAAWFDRNYRSAWTPDEFLDAMEKVGIF